MTRPNVCDAPRCGATLMWRPNVKTGKLAPVDSHPYADGNIVLEGDGYRVLTKDELVALDQVDLFDQNPDPISPKRYKLHFATCTDPDRFRRCRNCHKSPCACGTNTTTTKGKR